MPQRPHSALAAPAPEAIRAPVAPISEVCVCRFQPQRQSSAPVAPTSVVEVRSRSPGPRGHGIQCHCAWHPLPRSAVYVMASIAIRSHAGTYTPWHLLPSIALRASHPLQAMASVASYGIRCQLWHPLPSMAPIAIRASHGIRCHPLPCELWLRANYGIRCRHGIHCHPCEPRIRCKLWHPLPAMASVASHGTHRHPFMPWHPLRLRHHAEPRCRSPAPEAGCACRTGPRGHGIQCHCAWHPSPRSAVYVMASIAIQAHAGPYTPWHPLPSMAM